MPNESRLVQAELRAFFRAQVRRHPGAVVGLRTARGAARSGAIWGYVFGLVVASSALGYASAYKTHVQRERLAALFGSNAGLAAIDGPAHALATVAGYTEWKSFMFLTVVGAIWGVLTGTRLLRGEEDAGRWELLLAGRTTMRRAAAQALGGLALGLLTLWTITALVTVAVGRSSEVRIGVGSALFFALSLAAAPAVFLAAGALASELAPTRRMAGAYAGTALGVCYALRLVADSGNGLGWLRWATPLGWMEQLQPLTSPRPMWLLPVLALVVLEVLLTVHLAGRRDLGEGVLPDRDRAVARTRLMSVPWGLTVRLLRPVVLGWSAAICATALLMGFIAKQGGLALSSSSTVERVVSRLGAGGTGAADYLGFVFLIVAVMISFVAIGQVAACHAEEAEGHLDHLFAGDLPRTTWLAARVAVGVIALVATGLLAGVFGWFGAASQGSTPGLMHMLGAGMNLVAPALVVLGVGMLAIGVRARASSVITFSVVAWSLLIEVVGGVTTSNHWLEDTSVFHQMTAAPAVSPDWASAATLAAIGTAGVVLGAIAFRRRDLAGE